MDVVARDERAQMVVVAAALTRRDASALIDDGVTLPPVEAIASGKAVYVYDGLHRLTAWRDAAWETVPVSVEPGTLQEAQERALLANVAHGLRRSNADKRRAVELAFALMARLGENWSSHEVARRCGVSVDLVARTRPIYPKKIDSQDSTVTVTRGGTTYQQDTSNIGRKRSKASATPTPEPAPAIAEGGQREEPDALSDAAAAAEMEDAWIPETTTDEDAARDGVENALVAAEGHQPTFDRTAHVRGLARNCCLRRKVRRQLWHFLFDRLQHPLVAGVGVSGPQANCCGHLIHRFTNPTRRCG